MDPITGKLVGLGGSELIKRLANVLSNDHLDETRAQLSYETVCELAAALQRLEGRLDDEVIERFTRRIADPSVVGFAVLLTRAALESATTERRKLLCAALAGGVLLDFETETRSRASRCFLSIEPSDAALLRRCSRMAEPRAAEVLQEFADRKSLIYVSLEQLRQLSLVAVKMFDDKTPLERDVSVHSIFVTRLGHDVLRFIAHWD